MTIEALERVNWFDFQKGTIEDFETDQNFAQQTSAANLDATAGSGILLDFAQEPIIFDSDNLDAFQQGIDAITTFDGQGILENPYLTSDQVGGNQLVVSVTGTRLAGFLKMSVVFLGKTFDNELTYEILELGDNMVETTRNHFKEVTNILFQNFKGNTNTTVDGYGSFDVGGTVVISEAGSMRLGRDTVIAQQVDEPNIIFRDFKTADPGKTLQTTLQEALGSSNDVDDLNINTTAAQTRTFAEGGTTDVIYGQKFLMSGDQIQKATLLLSLETGSTWTGTLVVGIRALQTSLTCSTDFLPEDDIGFDPDTVSVEEIAVDSEDLAERGVELTTTPQAVDFVFTGSNISNPSLSRLVEGQYYVLTVRRTGSTATGTIVLQEARNSDTTTRLTVFQNSVWTDVDDSTLWYRIRNDSMRVASGVMYDQGIRTVAEKTEVDNNGLQVQRFVEDIDLTNTGEDAQNYIIAQTSEDPRKTIAHPRTGDDQISRVADIPTVSSLEQSEVEALITAETEPVILGRVRDRNARSNPAITGTTALPGLVSGNVFTIINPGSDLLTQNVVGSTLIPNTAKPTLQYRIIKQTTFTDLYGDLNLDGLIDIDDAARLTALDGYGTDLNSGTLSASEQLAAWTAGLVTVPELLRADVDDNGIITNAGDGAALNAFITSGTALPAGSSFTRMELEVEPILNPIAYLNTDATSTLQLEVNDPDFIDNASFTSIPFAITFIPTWEDENLEIVDLRRFVTTTFLDLTTADLSEDPENGGQNNTFLPGDVFLTGNVKELDGTFHPLDYERNIIELELPAGTTVGEVNIFETYVVSKMFFSDGTLVPATAINNSQVKFSVAISSYAKNLDGYDLDGYGGTADEAIGTFIDHDTGLLRLETRNIVYNPLYPERRTRILVTVDLKKAGFANTIVQVSSTDLPGILT